MIDRHVASENWSFSLLINQIKEKKSFEYFKGMQVYYPEYSLEKGGVNGWTALSMAAKEGHLEFVDKILAFNHPQLIHLETKNGYTPLHCAALCQDKQKGTLIAKRLVKNGANIHLCAEISGKTISPLLSALETSQNLSLTKLLLWHNAQLNSDFKLSPEAQNQFFKASKWVEKKKNKIQFMIFCLQNLNDPSLHLIKDVVHIIAEKAFQAQEF